MIKVPGATGDYHTDLLAKGRACTDNLLNTDYTFGFLHIKAIDDAGHDRNVNLKVRTPLRWLPASGTIHIFWILLRYNNHRWRILFYALNCAFIFTCGFASYALCSKSVYTSWTFVLV